jgi:hypothetical protein
MFQQPFTPFDPSCKGSHWKVLTCWVLSVSWHNPFACNSAMMSSVMK